MSNETLLMKVRGINGQLELYEDRVRISRKGIQPGALISRIFMGEKEIPVSHIYSIELKEVGFPTNGYIRFSHVGAAKPRGRLFLAPLVSNTVVFSRFSQSDFKEIKEKIEEKMKHPKPSWSQLV